LIEFTWGLFVNSSKGHADQNQGLPRRDIHVFTAQLVICKSLGEDPNSHG